MRYANKNQMIRECEDEIAMISAGRTCASRHIKLLCRNRTEYLKWKITRIQKDLPFDVVPGTKQTKTSEIDFPEYK